MSERRLLATVRRVPREHIDAYTSAWASLRDSATTTGAHAWRFRAEESAETYLEFLEFRAGSDPRARPDVAAALSRLEELSPGTTEAWRDATPTPPASE